MKILFDHQIFTMLTFGGISRYFAELHAGLQDDDVFSSEVCIKKSDNVNFQKIVLKNQRFKPPGLLRSLGHRAVGKIFPRLKAAVQNTMLSIDKVRSGDFDIFHPTYYDPYFIEALKGKPYVVTVYDMIHERFPEYFTATARKQLIDQKKTVIMQASHIIAISQRTKADLHSIYGLPDSSVTTVYLSSSFQRLRDKPERLPTVPERYLLFVGTRDIYKNFRFFFESIAETLKSASNLFLVCAGPPFSDEEKKIFFSHGLQHKVMQMYPDDSELQQLYAHAICLAYPSRYEGFGLPVLEAFACGCPVMTSNTSSLPEVGGDAVAYCLPDDADSIRNGIIKIVDNAAYRSELVGQGYEQLARFSWSNTVEETKHVYSTVMSSQ